MGSLSKGFPLPLSRRQFNGTFKGWPFHYLFIYTSSSETCFLQLASKASEFEQLLVYSGSLFSFQLDLKRLTLFLMIGERPCWQPETAWSSLLPCLRSTGETHPICWPFGGFCKFRSPAFWGNRVSLGYSLGVTVWYLLGIKEGRHKK